MPGRITSTIEVTHISAKGIWILANDSEYFLSYADFPWFKKATIEDILDVKLLSPTHLYWEKLDIDLDLDSIQFPEKYPLIYK